MTPVVVTGAGLVTPLAQSAAALHQALSDGSGGIGQVSTFSTNDLPCRLGAAIAPDALDDEMVGRPTAALDKAGWLSLVAAQRAMVSSRRAVDSDGDIGLVVGTMFSGARTIGAFDRRAQSAGPACASPLDFANTVLNAPAGQTAIRLTLRGINATIAAGYASGLQAVAYGSDLIATGRASALLAGGVEELFPESYVGFCRTGVICGTNGRAGHVPVPFDSARTGLVLGEGAAFVVLEDAAVAQARGAQIRGRIAGYASATDPDALEQGFCGRDTIAEAIRRALARAGMSASDVDAISASANGSYVADAEEAAALACVFAPQSVAPAITAMKSVTGEMLGASGPLQVIAMLEAMATDCLPGIRGLHDACECQAAGLLSATPRLMHIRTALVMAVSPEGSCCALLVRAPEERS